MLDHDLLPAAAMHAVILLKALGFEERRRLPSDKLDEHFRRFCRLARGEGLRIPAAVIEHQAWPDSFCPSLS